MWIFSLSLHWCKNTTKQLFQSKFQCKKSLYNHLYLNSSFDFSSQILFSIFYFYSRALFIMSKMVPLETTSLEGCFSQCLSRRWSFLLCLQGKSVIFGLRVHLQACIHKDTSINIFHPKKDYKNTCVTTKAEWLLYLCNCFGLCKYIYFILLLILYWTCIVQKKKKNWDK